MWSRSVIIVTPIQQRHNTPDHDVYKGILTMEVLHACSSCFTGALANDLWQGLFHSLQNVIRLLNLA